MTMQAIVFANRQGNELSPLTQEYCPALLNVGNKALIEYTIEDLAAAGITQIKVVCCNQSKAIRQLLGAGDKWGVKLSYFLSKPEESVQPVLNRLALSCDELLLIRGDILRSPCVRSFIEFASKIPNQFIQANIAHHSAGLQLHYVGDCGSKTNQPRHSFYSEQVNKLDWPLSNTVAMQNGVTQVLHGTCYLMDTLECYLAANLALAEGKIPGLVPNGRPHPSAASLHLDVKAQVTNNDYSSVNGIIGRNTQICSNVHLSEQIVIGKGCFISDKSSIKNSLVLDNTFVGKGLTLENCIVSKNLLINLNNVSHSYIDDASLLADTAIHSLSDDESSNHTYTNFGQRIFALLLFIVTLPLQAVAMLMAHVNQRGDQREQGSWGEVITDITADTSNQNPHNSKHQQAYKVSIRSNPLKSVTLLSNQGELIKGKQWRVKHRALARLPQLLHVVSGKLALLGVNPQHQQDTGQPIDDGKFMSPQVSKKRSPMPLRGVFGPVQLQLAESAPLEEQQLVEAEFATKRGISRYISLLLSKGEFSHLSQEHACDITDQQVDIVDLKVETLASTNTLNSSDLKH